MQKMEGGPFSQYTELPVKQYQGMQTHPSDRLSTDREQADSEEKGQSWKAKFLNGSWFRYTILSSPERYVGYVKGAP